MDLHASCLMFSTRPGLLAAPTAAALAAPAAPEKAMSSPPT